MDKFSTTEIKLYEDICRTRGEQVRLRQLTQEQVNFLISLTYSGIHIAYREDGMRGWKVPKKGKHGGFLRLARIGETLNRIGKCASQEEKEEELFLEN